MSNGNLLMPLKTRKQLTVSIKLSFNWIIHFFKPPHKPKANTACSQVSAPTLSNNHSDYWRGVSLYKSVADAACRLVESLSVEGAHRGIPESFAKWTRSGGGEAPRHGIFVSGMNIPTCVASQCKSMRRSPEGTDVQVDGEQERQRYRAHGQRQQQVEHRPQLGSETHRQ